MDDELPEPRGRGDERVAALRPADSGALDDAALARALAQADPHAAAELWDRYSSLVRRVMLRTLGAHVDVEDAVQETFVRVFRSIGRLRDGAALRAFVLGVASHVLGTELRRLKRRRARLADREPPDVGVRGSQEARLALRRLYAILDTLSPELRVIFVLRHVEQLEVAELAEVVGRSPATVKRRLQKARELVLARARRDAVLAGWIAHEGTHHD